jgi:hypothetical protein
MKQRDFYHVFDKPVVYKDLLLHPIKVKECYEFAFYSTCLLLEKNSIQGNPELALKAISMTRLEFLFESNNDENKLIARFDALLKLCTKDWETIIVYGKEPDGKPFFKVGETKYNSADFDEIRNIIAEQNLLDIPDERIQKNVRDSLEEARRFKERVSNSKTASLEDQMIALAMYAGWGLNDVYDMPYRKFVLSIRRANHMIMSDIYLNASMSGFVKFKDKSVLRGWLTDLETGDKYSDVKMNPEQLAGKASFDAAKK